MTNSTDQSATTPETPAFVVRLSTTSATAAVLDELLATTDLSFSLWDDAEDNRAVFSFYAETATVADSVWEALAALLESWQPLLAGSCELAEVAALPREDWSESWKRHFRCTQVSDRVVVTPSWERHLAPALPAIVQVDPGMAFGTGLHGTSRACLRLLDEATGESPVGELYDIGCGTGILAIAAAKLGWSRVRAIDLCPDAVSATLVNLEINDCREQVVVEQGDLAAWEPGGRSPLVIVNVLAPIIIEHAERLVGWVADDGKLVVSGILTTQFQSVLERFATLGFELERELTLDKWTSGRLRRTTG